MGVRVPGTGGLEYLGQGLEYLNGTEFVAATPTCVIFQRNYEAVIRCLDLTAPMSGGEIRGGRREHLIAFINQFFVLFGMNNGCFMCARSFDGHSINVRLLGTEEEAWDGGVRG